MFSKLGRVEPIEATYRMESLFQRRPKRSRHEWSQGKKRINLSDPTCDTYLGPWGGFEHEARGGKRQTMDEQPTTLPVVSKDSVAFESSMREQNSVISSPAVYHGESEDPNWWIASAKTWKNVRPPEAACHLPGRLMKTLTGHRLGVQTIKLFPNTGHLVLSASLDSTIKIWDCVENQGCRMTYTGHSQAVRDISFAFEGEKFYSVGFDTNIRLWDTETGKIISSFSNNKLNYCIAVHPKDCNSIIVGNENHTAIQYDALSGNVVQVYNEHLGSVSSITFCEDGKKLVTTSDDRKFLCGTMGFPLLTNTFQTLIFILCRQ